MNFQIIETHVRGEIAPFILTFHGTKDDALGIIRTVQTAVVLQVPFNLP